MISAFCTRAVVQDKDSEVGELCWRTEVDEALSSAGNLFENGRQAVEEDGVAESGGNRLEITGEKRMCVSRGGSSDWLSEQFLMGIKN